MAKFGRKQADFQDMGLGNSVGLNGGRMVNKDGSFNVKRRGMSRLATKGLYHWLITMRWSHFILMVVVSYFAINFVFACLYMLLGMEHLDGVKFRSFLGRLEEAFFFSTQTFTTVGYGRVNPVGFPANLLAAMESLTGLLSFALTTGILYGRFSKPEAKILFSRQAVIAPFQEGVAFMFRIANQRDNQLIELEVNVSYSNIEIVNGVKQRRYHSLTLERSKVNFFPLSWTIVHPINEESPLYGKSIEEMIADESEILILLKAFDDTFSQVVYSRGSFKAEEIEYGSKFTKAFASDATGRIIFDLHRLSETESVELPYHYIRKDKIEEMIEEEAVDAQI